MSVAFCELNLKDMAPRLIIDEFCALVLYQPGPGVKRFFFFFFEWHSFLKYNVGIDGFVKF